MKSSEATTLNNVARMRWGSWRALAAGTDGEIKSAREFQGKLYVGGHFLRVNGFASASLAVWNEPDAPQLLQDFSGTRADGGVDLSFGVDPAARFDVATVWRSSSAGKGSVAVAQFGPDDMPFRYVDRNPPASELEYWTEFEVSDAPNYRSERFAVATAPIPNDTSVRLLGSNPLAGSGDFLLSLARPGAVQLQIFDARGRLMRTLQRRSLPAIEQFIHWDGRDESGRALARGVYHLRLEMRPTAGDRTKIQRSLKFTLSR
jgi:hypothetical protein